MSGRSEVGLLESVPDVGTAAACAGDGAPASDVGPRTSDRGRLSVAVIDGASAAVAVRAGDPLKLLVPRPRGKAVLAWTSTYGGGLVGGDRVDLGLDVGPGARLLLATQSSTKVYRARDDGTTSQSIAARVGDGALLALLPEPVCCFADARYRQQQHVDLAADGSLVLVDGLVAGRSARSERWAFAEYRTRTAIAVAGRSVLVDATRLERGRGLPIGERFGGCDALATIVLLGPLLAPLARALLAEIASTPAGDDPVVAASQLADGAIVRLAGSDPAAVAGWIAQRLGDALAPLLDHHHWQRKP